MGRGRLNVLIVVVKDKFKRGFGCSRMKLKIKSNFDPGAGDVVLSGTGCTLRELMQELSRRNWRKMRFIDTQTNDIEDFFVVSVNRKDYRSLPQGIETVLKDGDEVQVDVVSFIGG